MFRTRTLFVLGAGTSVEFGFPSGPGLLGQIRRSLDFRFDHFASYPKQGDAEIFEAIKTHFKESTRFENTTRVIEAGHTLVSAAEHHVSIDNAIDALESDEISFAGKLAIAKNILRAEANLLSKLQDPDDRTRLRFDEISGTWLILLLKLISTDIRKSEIDKISENIKIINFNYDRIIEFILPQILAIHYGVDEAVSSCSVREIEFIRPYGSLGHISSNEPARSGIRFGAGQPEQILRAAADLRTFTEQIEDKSVLSSISSVMDWAERIVFLGFGYHRQNIDLLARTPGRAYILGTSYGISNPDVSNIQDELQHKLPGPHHLTNVVDLVPSKCGELLQAYGRLLTS